MIKEMGNGYFTLSSTGDPIYHFYLKDHQGNNRVVVSQSGSVEQINHYYPYGALFAESTNGDVQRFKYNGLLSDVTNGNKELDRKFGLDWYDHGARHNDAAIGRWHSMDPMAEKYYGISPYAYCGGDPVNKGDYNGMEVIADSLSQIAIINSLPQEERHLVSFNSDGSASVQLSDNSSEILQTFNALVSSSNIYEIKVSPVDMNGKAFSNDPNDYYYGYTQTPIDPDYPSTDGKIHIFISSLLSEVDQALNYGHEALSHGYFFEIGKPYGHDPYLEGTEVFNEELNCTGFDFIWKDRNIELINQIKKITELIKQNIKSE